MIPGKIERREPFAGAKGVVAERFDEVAKELHVQLVILDNEDGFGHAIRPKQLPGRYRAQYP